jgi:hypothetical protein
MGFHLHQHPQATLLLPLINSRPCFVLASNPENLWISNLIKNPGLALLLVDRFGKLVLLHNLSYLHKSIFCEESKVQLI